jgi:hypothetical protein
MPQLIHDVVVLGWDTPTASDLRASRIAAFLGAETTFVALSKVEGGSINLSRCTCLIVEAETLASAAEAIRGGTSGLHRLMTDVADHVFVYGFQPTERHDALLRTLSVGDIRGVQKLPGHATYQVADNHRRWCGQFSGLSFGATNAEIDRQFVEGTEGRRHETLVRAGHRPFVVRATVGRCQLFLSACAELADLDELVGRRAAVLSWFSRLVPLMMFLRGALGNRVWHNDNPRACFIIDDPLMKNDRYGFLEYPRLVQSMRRQKFSASIAFIPWNYRRSSDDVTTFVSSRHDVLSLCVHGCDHTGGEFAVTDLASLRTKAQTALERMETHQRTSGVPFDAVMVFPQGLFSVEAIAALKASGYLAAVNSDVFPSTEPESLRLGELLDVAITKCDDFPLFGRRYPRDLAEFAFDLFMGKPALAVEHHGYFRHGYTALESFVDRLNSLDERLQWSSLGTICSRASLTRDTRDGDHHVRFYTNRFMLTNRGTRASTYFLARRDSVNGPPPAVTVNGREWERTLEGGQLQFCVSLSPGDTADIKVGCHDADTVVASWYETTLHRVKVRIRRHLSEFRDNKLDTNRALTAIATTARNFRSRDHHIAD